MLAGFVADTAANAVIGTVKQNARFVRIHLGPFRRIEMVSQGTGATPPVRDWTAAPYGR